MKVAEGSTSATTAQKSNPFFYQERNQSFFGHNSADASFFKVSGPQARIQTKLSIGKPGDPYEQEADAMADKVVQRLSEPEIQQSKLNPAEKTAQKKTVQPVVQLKCGACEREEKLQKKEIKELPEDKLRLKSIFENNEVPPEDEIQRKCAECEAEEKLQKKGEDTFVGPSLERTLSSSKGSGSPLAERTRMQMESSFGANFSNVRIHTDHHAVQMSQGLKAQAFTHGSDIYFNSGKYNPANKDGQELLAHELTHTIQQGTSGGQSASSISSLKNEEDQQLISRSPLFVSDMEICHRVLQSRTFRVTDGNLFVKIFPNVSDPANPNCQHHQFRVTLSEENDLWFDEELSTTKLNSGKAVELLWANLPVGNYYLTFSRLYDNPNCCLVGDIEVTQATEAEAREKVCAYMREKKQFPSQHGGVWDWLGTGHDGKYGPGRRLAGPLEIYETDPAIISGSTCRGACGPNCETCTELPVYYYRDPLTGIFWKYSHLQICDSHEGCRQHDAAFDWAAAEKGEVGRWANLKRWHMAANTECACNYPPLNCAGWISGKPPHDMNLYFADKVEPADSQAYPGGCREQNPDFTFCSEEGADMYEVLVLWGLENGYENFRGCRKYWDFEAGIIEACDYAPGRTWHCTATDMDTGEDVTISIFDCFCCREDDDSSGSDFRRPHVSGGEPRGIGDPSRDVPMISKETFEKAENFRRRKKYAQALKEVVDDLIASGRVDSSLFTIEFVNRTDEGEGLTTTRYRKDPATGDYVPDGPSEVEIYTPAFSSLQLLVSTIMHEYQHVAQGQRTKTPEELRDVTGEHAEAAETEAYLWEIEHADETGLVIKPYNLRNTFDRLTEHYNDLGQINPQRQVQYKERYEAAEKFINDVNEPPPSLPGYTNVYHHGSDYDTIEALRTVDITATGRVDFGQGFYTHTKDNWGLTREWALRHSLSKRGWGVVTFPIPDKAWREEIQEMLHFRHSRSRPANMPINPDTGKPFKNWEDFVKYNKKKGREGDLPSWEEFDVIRGPLWGRLSRSRVHQVMFTASGVDVLNRPDVKPLRFIRRWLFLRYR